MKKQAITNLTMILWIFLIGSFFGFIYENLLMIIKGHPALRQGLIYEPLIPIYGIGSIVFYLFYKNINLDNKSLIIKIIISNIIGIPMFEKIALIESFPNIKIHIFCAAIEKIIWVQ